MADAPLVRRPDSHPIIKAILRFLLKILWSIGGDPTRRANLPRLHGSDAGPLVDELRPGDFLAVGNHGGVSHIAMYVGDREIIHSMATEHTMRGLRGSLWDAAWRPIQALRQAREKVGVLREPLAAFLDRFERDTAVVLRHDRLTPSGTDRGLAHIRSLVGKGYDYDFTVGDDEYYCTEIVMAFLDEALAPDERPAFDTTHHRVPLLLDAHVVEPVDVLRHASITAVLATESALARYEAHLREARIFHRKR